MAAVTMKETPRIHPAPQSTKYFPVNVLFGLSLEKWSWYLLSHFTKEEVEIRRHKEIFLNK